MAEPETPSPRSDALPRARKELLEAVEHLRNAARILFERAAAEPAVQQAGRQTERIIGKVAEAAEPIAQQVTEEVRRLTRTLSDAVQGVLSSRAKSDDRPSKADDEKR
ncbi:MAG: hypothetical protein NZ898_14845 [Myxococcota bacterium]|nr:hypothetical protein [Myxococcota bacterium]MDW8361127.1 hypothetical protein [Myxococcales bacterium]